ncbi:hypothetical protein GCM10023238_38600 [Streptomyces heliomycini]
MTRFTRWTALTVAAALLTAGCSGSSDDGGKSGGTALDWGRCKASGGDPTPGGEWQCATLRVPLDWSKPTAPWSGSP